MREVVVGCGNSQQEVGRPVGTGVSTRLSSYPMWKLIYRLRRAGRGSGAGSKVRKPRRLVAESPHGLSHVNTISMVRTALVVGSLVQLRSLALRLNCCPLAPLPARAGSPSSGPELKTLAGPAGPPSPYRHRTDRPLPPSLGPMTKSGAKKTRLWTLPQVVPQLHPVHHLRRSQESASGIPRGASRPPSRQNAVAARLRLVAHPLPPRPLRHMLRPRSASYHRRGRGESLEMPNHRARGTHAMEPARGFKCPLLNAPWCQKLF